MANKLYNFSCDVSAGRLVGCQSAIGGIQKIYLMSYVDELESYFTPEAGASLYEIKNINTAITVKQFDLRPNTASYNATITTSDENGTMFYEQVLEVALAQINSKDLSYINNIAQGRCQAWVLDANNRTFLMGAKFGCTVTGGAMSTGQAKADRSGWTLTFTAQEQINYVLPESAGAGTTGFPFDGLDSTVGNVTINGGDYPSS